MDAVKTPGQVRCVIVTPEKAVADEVCDFVALPMYDGEVGIAPLRRPLIGRLGFGELRTRKGNVVHHWYVDGGFVQVRNDVVTVLTSKAMKATDIKIEAAQASLAEAQKPANTPEGIDANLNAQERARAQIRVAQKAAGTPATH
ncbi:MAG: ATP synthase F1 subunit epsilon [Gemmataceae bacterium]|nr:ATP synthase F1 subunit epsilon [Gemmataceae bacterium]